MKKSRVGKIVDLFRDIDKQEVLDLQDRLAKELHIYIWLAVPVSYIKGFDKTGQLLKED